MTQPRKSDAAGPQILDACCGGRMWWWDKSHPLAVYMDVRKEPPGCRSFRPNFEVAPDVVGDFRAMPFEDESFQLVVFDPPHLVRTGGARGQIRICYGELPHETEQDDLRRGFAECWRVLAPGGTLIFKWADKLSRVEPLFPATPIVGSRNPRVGQTRWFVFYKPFEVRALELAVAIVTQPRKSDAFISVDVEILRALRRVSSAESRWLAEQVGVARNSMGSRLASLRRRGLINRHNRPGSLCDRMWFLTENGRRVIE